MIIVMIRLYPLTAEILKVLTAVKMDWSLQDHKMTGRVMIVTGANSGIGYEVARYLAEGGNDVVLACRDKDKGEEAMNRIRRELPNSLVTFMMVRLPCLLILGSCP